MNNRRASQRRARTLLEDLRLPEPWDVRALVDQVAQRRGRRIVLEAVPGSMVRNKMCGAWLECEDEDMLLYSEDSAPWHCDLVICHELGHMLFGHEETSIEPPVSPEMLRAWVPSLDPAAVVRVLGRTNYSTKHEYEAEYLATLIIDRAFARPHRSGLDERTGRMLATFVPD